MNKRKIILDVDTGTDDAVAIIAALNSPGLEVVSICTVNGNQPIDYTTENTLRVLDLVGSKVPVIKGCSTPMVAELDPRRHAENEEHITAEKMNMSFYMQYIDLLPPATSKISGNYAPLWYVETLMNSSEKLTLVPVGPLTNLGIALRIEPRIVDHIEEIVIMGGGHEQRNISSAAELNIWIDPEAAQIVLECGAPITLVPLDATHKALLTHNDAAFFKKQNTEACNFICNIIEENIENYSTLHPQEFPGAAPIHDALCIAYLIDPSVMTTVDSRVDVDCSGGVCDGRTICDLRTYRFKPNNVKLALDADSKKFSAMMREILSR